MSGHSKWSTIKRAKGAADAKRGQLFTKLGREIMIAARDGGGDPTANARLRLAVQKARDANMPVDNIERAIKKATGGADASTLAELSLECYGPGGAAVLIEVLTDNRNRTISEIRSVLTRNNANLGESGSVSWVFDKKGIITVKASGDTDELALWAIDAGADDVKVEGEEVEIQTRPEDAEMVRKALEMKGVSVLSAEVTLNPKTLMPLSDKDALQTLKLVDKLEDIDGVQHVFTNADFPDAVVESFRAG